MKKRGVVRIILACILLIVIAVEIYAIKENWMGKMLSQRDSGKKNEFFVISRETAKNDTAEHSYEYVVSDASWSQAQEEAQKKGGYLVNINSKEEFDRIISGIEENGYDDILFRIGGQRTDEDSLYYWIDADHQQIGEALNTEGSWCKDLWASGEPSFEYKDTPETCMDMYQSDGTWLWNDVPDNMIEVVSDAYKGRLGYIIEFDGE